MIFKDEEGKIYEVPAEKYAEFEVSGDRAKSLLNDIKKFMLDTKNIEDIEVNSYQDIIDNHVKLHGKKPKGVALMQLKSGEYKSAHIFY